MALLLVGDSMTMRGQSDVSGWVNKLTVSFAGRADVVVRGYSGYNTRWVNHYWNLIMENVPTITVAVVWLGANDSVLASVGTKQFVPVDEYGQYLIEITNALHRKGCQRVVLLPPPPVDEAARVRHQKAKYRENAFGFSERTCSNTKLYAAECERVADSFDTKAGFINLFETFSEFDSVESLFSDGLHLSDAGNQLVFEQLMHYFEREKLSPDHWAKVLPNCIRVPAFPPLADESTKHISQLTVSKELPEYLFKNLHVWEWASHNFVRRDVLVSSGKVLQVSKPKPRVKGESLAQREIDMESGYALPGLADAHIHVYHMGESQHCANLESCQSIAELQAALAEFAAKNADREWIVGVGWDHEKMGQVLPSRADLDAALPAGRKAFLWRVCFHIGVASTAALEAANVLIDKAPANLEGGAVDVDLDGRLTGILREAAVDLVVSHIKEPSSAMRQRYLLDGLDECLRAGLTSVQTNDAGMLKEYQQLDDLGKLPIRVHLTAVPGDIEKPFRSESGMLTCDRIKLFTDGALGAATAAIREEKGEYRGILMHSREELNALVSDAKSRGLRLEAHAIGDMAAQVALDAFDQAGLTREDRPVLTHCQVLGKDLILRMAAAGVIANVQPSFVPTDAQWVRERLEPDKLPFSYCWRSLINHGIQVSGGSDCPVEPCSPLKGMFDAIFRPSSHTKLKPVHEKSVFLPDESLAFPQALHLYTSGAQFAACQEVSRGRIEPGCDADFTVLDRDVSKAPELLAKAKVQYVIVDGQVKFDRANAPPPASLNPRNRGPYAFGKGGDRKNPLRGCRCPHKH